jgi:hypothetical protein
MNNNSLMLLTGYPVLRNPKLNKMNNTIPTHKPGLPADNAAGTPNRI